MSGRLMRAASSVPATNPNCTASVSPEAPEESRCHSSRRAGADAEALNQSVIPSSSAVEMSRSARQRAVLCMRSNSTPRGCGVKLALAVVALSLLQGAEPDYAALAERITGALRLHPGERILIRFDPGYFH